MNAVAHQASVCAAEHHTWAEGACQADWRCALLDQLSRQGEGQGNGCSSLPCYEPAVIALHNYSVSL